FGGLSATVDDFAGNILDASSATTPFLNISGTSLFTTEALSFNINFDGVDHTFTYRVASPTAASGQFNNLNNLAAAIDFVDGLTARVVGGRLYVSAEDANKAISFSNGDALPTSGV